MGKKLRSASSVAEKFIESTPQGLTLEEQEARGQQPLIKEQEGEQAKPQPKEEKPEPEQAEPTKDTEAQDEQKKKPLGQPKKYDEPTKHVSFALPVSVIEDLKILAGLKKTNQTQLILSMIKNEIAIEADRIEAYKVLVNLEE